MRNALDFSMRERRGIIVLLSIMLLCIVLPEILRQVETKDQKHLIEVSFLQFVKMQKQDVTVPSPKKIKMGEAFLFDPNTVDLIEMNRLGFPEYLSERVIKYRSAGGVFRKKQDLKKIYGMPVDFYTEMEPWIQLPESPIQKPKKTFTDESIVLDLNKSDSSEFIKIKGIGSVYSSRIIKYRSALGGYADKTQLKEVYGIDEEENQLLKN